MTAYANADGQRSKDPVAGVNSRKEALNVSHGAAKKLETNWTFKVE
jgi:hypothetical protein